VAARRVSRRALVLVAVLGFVVGLAFLVARPHVPDPATNPYFGVRGGARGQASGIVIHYRHAGAERPVDPSTVLAAGDGLRFGFKGESSRYLELRIKDGDGPVTTVFPVEGSMAGLVRPGEGLPSRAIVAPGGARLLVTALFSDRPWPVGSPPQGDIETASFSIAKQ
jgi:hypothetical protein